MMINVNDERSRKLVSKGEFGIEEELLRVDGNGSVSQSAHPFDSPNITRDFCENQTEFVTDVFDSPEGAARHLRELMASAVHDLSGSGELFWRFSNPPALSSPDEIPIAEIGREYRCHLAERYGKVKMLLSGIHLNFSLPRKSLSRLAGKAGQTEREFGDALYLSLASRLLSYSWLIVYLTAASPVLDESFVRFGGADDTALRKYSSVRCGEEGYWNHFTPVLDYSSVSAYSESIEKYVKSGAIISLSELYYPVRVKPRGKYSLESLRENGINHIELRMIDINPISDIGIFTEDIEFIHLLMIYLMSKDIGLPDESNQRDALHNMKQAAMFDDDSRLSAGGCELTVKSAAAIELNALAEFSAKYYPQFSSSVSYQMCKLGGSRYAQIIRGLMSGSYMQRGLAISRQRGEENVHAVCGKCRP